MDRATGKQLKPKIFSEYLCNSMNLGNRETLVAKHFTYSRRGSTDRNIEASINSMENNKPVGLDVAHVEILKKATQSKWRNSLQKFGGRWVPLGSFQVIG